MMNPSLPSHGRVPSAVCGVSAKSPLFRQPTTHHPPPTPHHCGSWLAWVVGAVACLWGGWNDLGAQAVVRPVVGVRFQITERGFIDGLGGRKAEVEAAMAQRIAEHCGRELSYVTWQTLTNPPSAGDPPWVLLGTMRGEGSQDIPEVVLIFEKQGPGQPPVPLLRESMYPANIPGQPTQNMAVLLDHLMERARRVFENSDSLLRIQTRFLAGIPIATQLEASLSRKRLLLPSRWEELLPGDGSLLRAQYQVLHAGGETIPVKLQMSPSVPLGDRVACAVTLFDYPPVNERDWHTAIPESLSNAVPATVRVFMQEYVKDYNFVPTTADGLVLDPFGGTGGGAP